MNNNLWESKSNVRSTEMLWSNRIRHYIRSIRNTGLYVASLIYTVIVTIIIAIFYVGILIIKAINLPFE